MSLVELNEEFCLQKRKLNIFGSIQKNDKIMENGEKGFLYIEPPGYSQMIKRWWYGEDKKTTFRHLDTYFTEFMRFLDNIIAFSKAGKDTEIVPLGHAICEYINKIIPGIHMLKATYPDYVQLHNKIDSIIVTLIDFKTDFRKTIGYNGRHRSLSF